MLFTTQLTPPDMTEPNNPLFEDEKEFLERKKLEYERALLGDVEEIKEQTVQVGKVVLVGASVVGGIWLLTKAFGGRKHKPKKKHKKKEAGFDFDHHAGFDGFEDDKFEEELHDLTGDYHSPEYNYADRYAAEGDGFYQAGNQFEADYLVDDYPGDASGENVGDDQDSDSQYGASVADTTYGSHNSDADHLAVYHTDEDYLAEAAPSGKETVHSYASPNSYQARPYDDSRRLPDSDGFAAHEEPEKTSSKKPWLVPAIVSFAQSETGKVVLAQVAAVAMAFISNKVKDILPSNVADTDKNAELAASSAPKGVSPEVWPATSVAQDVSAAAHHDDTIAPRAPLA